MVEYDNIVNLWQQNNFLTAFFTVIDGVIIVK